MQNGQQVPMFHLTAANGEVVSLAQLLEQGDTKRPVVVFFYPKNGTPGCTQQMCTFRDEHTVFAQHGAAIVGISADSLESHKQTTAQHQLPFPLLTDVGGDLRKAWNIPKFMGVFPHRVTVVLDGDGRVYHQVVDMFNVKRHIHEALAAVRQLTNQPVPEPL